MRPKWLTTVLGMAPDVPEFFKKFATGHQQFLDNITTMTSNNLTFKDNMLSSVIQNRTFEHGKEEIVTNPFNGEIRPLGAIGFSQSGPNVDNVKLRVTDKNLKTLGVTVFYQADYGYAQVSRGVNQSIPNNTPTALVFDTQTLIKGNLAHNLAVNPTRITCLADGIIEVTALVTFQANVTAQREVQILHNSTTPYGRFNMAASPLLNTVMSPSALIPVSEGDYIEVLLRQTSGGAINAVGGGQRVLARYVDVSVEYKTTPTIIIIGG